MFPEFCCICGSPLVVTSFDKDGAVFAVGLGCTDLHYAKVFGNGVMSEIVNGEWFSCPVGSPISHQVEWQRIINQAVFRACRKHKAGQFRLARL